MAAKEKQKESQLHLDVSRHVLDLRESVVGKRLSVSILEAEDGISMDFYRVPDYPPPPEKLVREKEIPTLKEKKRVKRLTQEERDSLHGLIRLLGNIHPEAAIEVLSPRMFVFSIKISKKEQNIN
jgi:hypothetical protein